MTPPTVPNARVVADSVSEAGHRVTTIIVTHHRFVLAELNTHRVFSRNGSSSRAVPTSRSIDRALQNPAVPLAWGTKKPGMQPGPPLTGDAADEATQVWLAARDDAVEAARRLDELGVHKELVNRLLEPFLWQTTIITATNWAGFFEQRCTPPGEEEGDAAREIRVAADAIRQVYDASTPKLVREGEWHTPLIQPDEEGLDLPTRIRVAEARCARVSYLTHDGRRDLSEDLRLYNDLVSATPPHWSPLEHCCTPAPGNVDQVTVTGPNGGSLTHTVPRLGNLLGWQQDRHLAEADRYGRRDVA